VARARVETGTRRRSARGFATMSTVRVKRKHVLDSDSDESEDEPAAGAEAQIATSVAEARVVDDASGGDGASPPEPSEPQRKRLMSAADREATRLAEAASAPITIDDDEAGDDPITIDGDDTAKTRVTKTRALPGATPTRVPTRVTNCWTPRTRRSLGARRSRGGCGRRSGGTSRAATGLCPR
jgi:hypothetical protein